MRNHHTIFWLAAFALLAWWAFVGDSPILLVRHFVGRGKKLSKTTMANGRDIDQTVDEVVAQVTAAMGRAVRKDAVILARVSANEHPTAKEREKSAIQWVCKNDADANGWSLEFTTTTARGCWGTQPGRRYSSHGEDFRHLPFLDGGYEIHEDDLFIAESILDGVMPDITGGARNFVHTAPAESWLDFLEGHPRVKQWQANGLTPVWLGDVSTLVVLLPSAKVTEEMSTTDPNLEASG